MIRDDDEDESYPKESELQRVQDWPADPEDWVGLLEFMSSIWSDYGIVRRREATLREDGIDTGSEAWEFVTGGWSGNESIIDAFYKNAMARLMMWESVHRGGLHILILPKRYQRAVPQPDGDGNEYDKRLEDLAGITTDGAPTETLESKQRAIDCLTAELARMREGQISQTSKGVKHVDGR